MAQVRNKDDVDVALESALADEHYLVDIKCMVDFNRNSRLRDILFAMADALTGSRATAATAATIGCWEPDAKR